MCSSPNHWAVLAERIDEFDEFGESLQARYLMQ